MLWSAMQRNETTAASAPAYARDSERLPVLPASQLFAATGTEGLIASIQSKCGFSAEHFERTVMPVLKAYAEFVQQLPAAGSDPQAQRGGLLIHGLEVADLALTFRRGQILPKGAAPEDIMRLEHRWTYAVFVAALTHDIGKHIADLRVMLYREESPAGERWIPFAEASAEAAATRYSVEFVGESEREAALDGKLPVILFQRLIPRDALGWLSKDRELISELMAVLAGEKDDGSGAIRKLVFRAEAEFSKRSSSAGSGVLHDQSLSGAEVPASADQPVADQSEPNAPHPATEEYLDDFEGSADEQTAKPGGSPSAPIVPKPQLPAPVALASPAPPQSAAKAVPPAPPEAALRFMVWLQAGLAQGTLRFNEIGAMVHFVKEGMLLVSPKIFQHFVSVVGKEGVRPSAFVSRDNKGLEMDIQKQLIKAHWHVHGEKGRSILPYQVLREGKPAASIFGVVIARPDRFVYPIPPANPHLVRAASSREA